MLVKDLMTPDPITVSPDMTVEALAYLLADRQVSGVFVVDGDGTPLGVATEADVLRRLAPEGEDADLSWIGRLLVDPDRGAARYARMHGTRVRDVMSSPLISVSDEAPTEEAIRLMRKGGIRRIAVMREGRLVGLVSRADLLRAVTAGADRLGMETADQHAQAALLREIRRQPWTHPASISVAVENGVVRLEGYYFSDAERQALRVLAERVQGVHRVDDRLEEMPIPYYAMVSPV